MKRILKIIPLVMIALLLSVISCQHDDATLQNEQVALQASQFTIKMKSGEHLREINPTVYQRLSETSRHTSSLSQTEDDRSMPSFTLDLSTIQIIERNTYTQYTTSVFGHSEYETYLINYLLLDFNDGAQYQFLVKHPRIFTNQGIVLDRLNAVMERIEGDVIFQAETGGSRPCLDGVPEIVDTTQEYQCTEFNCTGGNHTVGEECDCGTPGYSCIPAYEVCGWVTVNIWGCSSGGTSGTGTTSPTGGNSSDTNNADEGDEPIETIPFIPYWQQVVNCVNDGAIGSFDDSLPLSSSDIDWLQSQQASTSANAISDFIDTNGCEVSENFIDEAVEALRNGGEVDFEDKIILDPSFTGKAKCIYNKLKNQNLVKKALEKFSDGTEKNDLKFKLDAVGTDLKLFYNGVFVGYDRAITYLPNDNGVIVVSLNNVTNSNFSVVVEPNLLVAQTIFHEVIHAEFFRQLLDAINKGNFNGVTNQQVLDALANSQYELLYEYFRNYKAWPHNYMADYYRDAIARVTQEFDTGKAVPDNQEPQTLYKNLAWRGLMETDAWTELTATQKQAIENSINTYKTNNANQTCTN